MNDSELSNSARVVFSALDEHARDKAECFPSQAALCARLDISRRTLVRCLGELRKAGYLETARKGNRDGRNVYRLRHGCATVAPNSPSDAPKMAQPDAPKMAQPTGSVLISESEKLESSNSLGTSEAEAVVTVAEFHEIEDAWERHLKHHRSEPRDMVLQMLMDAAQRRVFDWEKFRARHADWCAAQERGGWQYATLTLLAWVRAGMPAAPYERRYPTKASSLPSALSPAEADRLISEAESMLASWEEKS